MQKYCAICLDIGGTFIKYAVITENGELINFDKERTCKSGAEGLINQISKIIEQLIMQAADYKIKGIGISSAGQIDHKNGKVIYATDNLPGWTGVRLKDIIEHQFKFNCYVENDVNAAALGEMCFGSAKGHEDFICITIGTGIGGAIVKGSEVIHGAVGSAGEVGHMVIKTCGRKCNCGNNGCYEQYASVTALKRMAREKLGKDYLPADAGVEWLLNMYDADGKVKILIDGFVKYVSVGIINLLHILNPSAVIIGGAVSVNGFLIKEIEKNVYKNAMPEFTKALKILPALLDNKASLFGVGTYVFNNK